MGLFGKKQVVIVTRASSGIGRAYANELIREGATVAASSRDAGNWRKWEPDPLIRIGGIALPLILQPTLIGWQTGWVNNGKSSVNSMDCSMPPVSLFLTAQDYSFNFKKGACFSINPYWEVWRMENLRAFWETAYSLFCSKFDNCFSYAKTAVRARDYVRGLMSGIERKNGWQLAEFIGDEAPYAVQNFLSRAVWNADKARDQLLKISPSYLLEEAERDSIIIDETGFTKKGSHSAGVKRQYSGTAGRIENSQIGVFMALAGSKGYALVDRELYLPKEWCADRQRLQSVGIHEQAIFQTKQQLAIKMLERAFSHGIQPQWVLADALYGSSYEFRKYLLDKKQAMS